MIAIVLQSWFESDPFSAEKPDQSCLRQLALTALAVMNGSEMLSEIERSVLTYDKHCWWKQGDPFKVRMNWKILIWVDERDWQQTRVIFCHALLSLFSYSSSSNH